MGLGVSISLYIVSIVLLAAGIFFIVEDIDGPVFLFFLGAFGIFLAAHMPPSVGPYYLDEDVWTKYDYAEEVVQTWYIDKETKDTVTAYIVEYDACEGMYKLSDGHEMNADLAVKNSGGIRMKKVMRQDNPYGEWAWLWDRIKIGNGE